MATVTAGDAKKLGARDVLAFVNSIRDAYENMGMTGGQYLQRVVGPALGLFVVLVVVPIVIGAPPLVALPLALIGVLSVLTALVYPKLVLDNRRKQIEERFHLFITHMTVLSTTNIDRMEIFRTLASEREYRALADEMAKIVALVDTWNQSLEEAARLRAKRTPSPLLADFLERMAYALGAGQEVQDFLLNEQDAIVGKFTVNYENDLDKLAVLKELYLSMTLSTTFALVFGIITPILTGLDPLLVIGGIIGLFILVEAGFLVLIHLTSPADPVWFFSDDVKTGRDRKMLVSHVVGFGGVALGLLGIVALWYGYLPFSRDVVPLPMYMAIPLVPLLYPALVMRKEEAAIKQRDESFGSFIRVLGAVESVKQSSTARVLEGLRKKDFGALTGSVESLYQRLNIRIDSGLAWRMFSAETGSYLIQKFSEMYNRGRLMGGEPARLGRLINNNFGVVIHLRERRSQETMTIIGILYGITATSVFAFFVGLEVVVLLMNVTSEMAVDAQFAQSMFNFETYDTDLITYLLMLTILLNALLSSLMVRVIDRGHFANAYLHFVLLTWVGSLTAWATKIIVGGVIQL